MASDSTPAPWPPPDLAAALDQPGPHAAWPPPDLAVALGPEGVTELDPALTAQEHAAAGDVSPAVLRARYGAAAGQGFAGDGDPGSPR